MAFAQVKGVARDPKDYEVYKKKERTQKQIKEDYLKSEGDMSGPRLKPEPKEELLQGNITKNIPKDEKPPGYGLDWPKQTHVSDKPKYESPWGPGGGKNV